MDFPNRIKPDTKYIVTDYGMRMLIWYGRYVALAHHYMLDAKSNCEPNPEYSDEENAQYLKDKRAIYLDAARRNAANARQCLSGPWFEGVHIREIPPLTRSDEIPF